MSGLLATERTHALRMLQQAVGTAAKVVGRKRSPAGHDAEVFRDDAPSVPLRLREWVVGSQGEPDTVWVLRKPSRGTLEQLRKGNQNYVALSGSVRLVANGFFLDRSDLKPVVRPLRRVDPFADRNSLVARTLLGEPGRRWGVREIAEAAGVSAATASLTVRALATMGVVDFRRRGRSAEFWIGDPGHLLRRWAGSYSWERNTVLAFAPPMGDPIRFLNRARAVLDNYRWALTMQAGASLVAPHATWDRVHLFVSVADPDELYDLAERAGWPPAEDGRLVLMKPYYKHSVWHGLRTIDALPVVSGTQLVLDLWHYPLRGMEQAEHLLNTTFPGR
jgi:hypothetical protein